MTRRLRILCVTGIFPPDIGGPATYVPRIAQALVDRGHRVTVLTLSDVGDADDAGRPYPVVRVWRGLPRPLRWRRVIGHLLRLGRAADVLFVNGLALEAAQANLALRKPLVHKVVGDLIWERASIEGWVRDSFETFQTMRYGLLIEGLKAVRSWWLRHATRVIVPSAYLARWVSRWGVPPDRLVVIHNAVEPAPASGLPPSLRLPARPRIVVVGRLVPWKHADGVLRAAAVLGGASVVVVGDGPDRASLEALAASLGLLDRVAFTGRLRVSETLAVMAACDVFVLNSTYEGFPHAVLEAMGLGLAVVATRSGGTVEVVHDGVTGVLVPPGNTAALVEVLRRLLSARAERERLGAAGRVAAARFALTPMVDATERVLCEAVTAGHA